MKRVVVIGASAGGIQSLCKILKTLPAQFPAPVMAVIHTAQESSLLPGVLARCGTLKVVSPKFVEPLTPGRLYVAAPNRHLVVRSNCVVSWMGPRENRHRPAVDTLFRTAARAYRSRVIAVVLSGALDDGSAGAMAVKARGGTVVVQNPDEAMVGDMPANVLREVKTDFCLPIHEISSLLVKLASRGAEMKIRTPTAQECQRAVDAPFEIVEPTGLTCPDCGGVVAQIGTAKNRRYRCHVGHAFSLESFSEAHSEALERGLWVALRKLNEQSNLQESLSKGVPRGSRLKRRYLENADAARQDMRLLQEILGKL